MASVVSIDVELDEFDDDDLIRDLKYRNIITEGEEKMLLAREGLIESFDCDYFELASDYARRGNAEECAIYLARAFPEFSILQRRPS